MQITPKQWLIAGAGVVLIALVVIILSSVGAQKPAQEIPVVATSTAPVATTTVAAPAPKPAIVKFPINPADRIASWAFKSAYTGNDTLTAKANADIAHLTSLIGKGQYDNYDLYIGIGNDYDLMGNGALTYQNYNRAVSVRPNNGLAYANLGHLMTELGALHTARDAYAKAVAVEPSVAQYRSAQIEFLTWYFPDEAAKLQAKQ